MTNQSCFVSVIAVVSCLSLSVAHARTLGVAQNGAEGTYATLQDALTDADANDVIEFAPSETPYSLTEAIVVSRAVTIRGGGESREAVTLTANNPSFTLLTIGDGGRIENLTVADVTTTSSQPLVKIRGDAVITNCVFRDNDVSNVQGVLTCSDSAEVHDCLFTGNTVKQLLIGATGARVFDSEFSDNSFGGCDGGIMQDGSYYRCRFLRNKVRNNTNTSMGRGGNFYDSLFVENVGQPGGLYSGARSYNCTYISNINCQNRGVSQGATHYNDLFYDNRGLNGSDSKGESSQFFFCVVPVVDASCSSCLQIAEPNLDPITWKPTWSSPDGIIDGGSMDKTCFPENERERRQTDLEGNARVKRINGTEPGGIDIGCFEFQGSASLDIRLTDESQELFIDSTEAGVVCDVEITVMAETGSEPSVLCDFGDGEEALPVSVTGTGETQNLTVRHVYQTGGFYDITVTGVVPGGDTVTVLAKDMVRVIDRTAAVVYVSADDGDDTNDGRTAATPKRSVRAAFGMAAEGAEIRLAPAAAVYGSERDACYTLPAGARIVGTGDSCGAVVIMREDAAHGFLKLVSADSSISNLTVSGWTGSLAFFDEPVIEVEAGALSDCAFSRNTGAMTLVELGRSAKVSRCRFDGNAVMHHILNGTAEDCAFFDNEFRSDGGILLNVSAFRCRLVRNHNPNRSGNCAPVQGGVSTDCLFVENQGKPSTIWQGESRNCTMVGNIGAFVLQAGRSHYNDIFYNNTNGTNLAVYEDYANSTKLYNCIVPEEVDASGSAGFLMGCIVCADPLLKPGFWSPLTGSCAIDAGLNDHYPDAESSIDLSGKARVKGRAIDLGCFEYHASSLIIVVR